MTGEQHHPLEVAPIPFELPARHPLGLDERHGALPSRSRQVLPSIDRMAVALHDPEMDLLKTLVNSIVRGEPSRAYQYKLSDGPSLLASRDSGRARVIDDIASELTSESEHARWVKSMGYRSSYTLPLFQQATLEGFLFPRLARAGCIHPESDRAARDLCEPCPAYGQS